MKLFYFLGSLCLAASVVACGGAPDTTASAAPGGAPSASPSAPSGSSALVPHEKLAALFPTIPGFKRETEPKGETDPAEGVSRVQGDYVQEGGGTGGLSVEMMDVSSNTMMLAAFKEIQRHPGVSKTDLGTQKTITLAGFPGYEEWTPQAGNGVVGLLVADRFLLTVTGSTVGDVSVIYKAIDAIDLKKIAALK